MSKFSQAIIGHRLSGVIFVRRWIQGLESPTHKIIVALLIVARTTVVLFSLLMDPGFEMRPFKPCLYLISLMSVWWINSREKLLTSLRWYRKVSVILLRATASQGGINMMHLKAFLHLPHFDENGKKIWCPVLQHNAWMKQHWSFNDFIER